MKNAKIVLMEAALKEPGKAQVNGNMSVIFLNRKMSFYYRGTPLIEWDMQTGQLVDIPTPFDDTPSTKAQRDRITRAIKVFNESCWALSYEELEQRFMAAVARGDYAHTAEDIRKAASMTEEEGKRLIDECGKQFEKAWGFAGRYGGAQK
jgi:hypothetical protein